ncbi:MAG: phosphodiester glycosidase family protein [Bauldia sp.]|uniref:phosphodiester glycosidase family protein n=1 Tax=Bauldia sp. TaxID=2575872 RepID=UPI001D28A558|nr:phosphodiester glycosidase family protein [Bauldia sp.]MCB1497454.1 phosphodiester glycosidase family protein [Bauldia sp.]
MLVAAVFFPFLLIPACAQTRQRDTGPEPELAPLLEAARAATETTLLPGLGYRVVTLSGADVTIHVFAFDADGFDLRTVQQTRQSGDHVADILDRFGGVFVINGGFFEKDADGRLSPSGLLVIDGVEITPEHGRAGSGILHAGANGIAIDYRADAPAADRLASAVQVGPVLVDAGGKVGIRSQGVRDRRSAICLGAGKIIAVVVDGNGLSLLRLAEFLAAAEAAGGVGCDIALNLDGGPSTQAMFRGGGREIAISGGSTVQNAVVLSIHPQ